MTDAPRTGSRASAAILADAAEGEAFRAIPDGPDRAEALRRIAAKIGRTRKPRAASDIPAGATYLAQFAAHDLDLRGREDVAGTPRLDLSLIYGDGPRHDGFAYQVPSAPGVARSLLRVGRARTTVDSPAWGAARDLPRTGCPHLDARGSEARTEVLIPNAFSDSNVVLGQVQTLWALLHNAVAAQLGRGRRDDGDVFESARRITRHVYRSALIRDVLGTWLLPDLRDDYVRDEPVRRSAGRVSAPPRVFMAGVARLGHGLVREIYELNDRRPFEGLRGLIRHNSVSRPDDMPLTEDWLLDFSRFFDIPGLEPAQRAREIGPHVPRPFGLGGGVGLDSPTPEDGMVLRDLAASSAADVPGVATVIGRIERAAPELLKGRFAGEARAWRAAVAAWLEDAGLPAGQRDALAADPPLTLFLMLEAEADAQGRTLGAVGSILLAETLVAALPETAPESDMAAARDQVFNGRIPARMAEVIPFLQRHYKFADGARLHPAIQGAAASAAPDPIKSREIPMLDNQTPPAAAGLVEVADYIELGRLVVDWTRDADSRPKDIAELQTQLDGIARVPETFTDVTFVEGKADVLVIRLPERGVTETTLARMEELHVTDRYMLPKFYDDIYHKHFGPVMTPLDTFLARIGDYTIAQCR